MNIIKGLIIKDLLQLKSYCKTLIVFILIFIVVSISQENTVEIGNMLVLMMTLGLGMFSLATFNYDEMSKADRYLLTLPLTRKQVVRAKYALVIGSTIVGSLIGIILSSIITFVMSKNVPNLLDLGLMSLGGILGIGLIESIQIPCIYKFGTEKGKIQMFIVTAGIALLAGGLFYMGEKANLPIGNLFESLNQFLPFVLIIAVVVMYGISYRISVGIFSKKEI